MAWNEHFERLRARLNRRSFAYRALFLNQLAPPAPPPWWAFWRRASGGSLSPAAQIVLDDLRRYCSVDKSTLNVSRADGHVDVHATLVAEGRRDVFNRIQAMLNLTDDQIERIAFAHTNDRSTLE